MRSLIVVGIVVWGAAGCGGSVGPGDGASEDLRDFAFAPIDLSGDMAGPRRLSWTGLYRDTANHVLAPDLIAFRPTYPLWSDAAEKLRYLRLPPGTTIDTSDMDHWRFPVGTQLFKEFSLDGKRLETRLIEKIADTGSVDLDFWAGAFLWLDDESDAIFIADGQDNVRGTAHDVPAAVKCWRCHAGDRGHILGFSALQLSGSGDGMRLDTLSTAGLLSHPPPVGAAFVPPGDDVTRRALGYLHANCGHCHNPLGNGWQDSGQVLRLSVNDTNPRATDLWKSTVGAPLEHWKHAPYTQRVVPGQPDQSALYYRMSTRGTDDQMPTLATELVDPDGDAAVRAWIQQL